MTERQRDGGLRQAQTRGGGTEGLRAEVAELQSDCLLATRSSLLAPYALPVGFTPGRPSFAKASTSAKATADKTADESAGRRAPATTNQRQARMPTREPLLASR
jgi:hypothetical protein